MVAFNPYVNCQIANLDSRDTHSGFLDARAKWNTFCPAALPSPIKVGKQLF